MKIEREKKAYTRTRTRNSILELELEIWKAKNTRELRKDLREQRKLFALV